MIEGLGHADRIIALESALKVMEKELDKRNRELAEAQRCFRFACKKLATFCFSRGMNDKSAGEWQKEIETELEGKP